MHEEIIRDGLCAKHKRNRWYPYLQKKEDVLEYYSANHDPHTICREVFGGCKKEVFECNSCGLTVCKEHWFGQDCPAKGMATDHDIPESVINN